MLQLRQRVSAHVAHCISFNRPSIKALRDGIRAANTMGIIFHTRENSLLVARRESSRFCNSEARSSVILDHRSPEFETRLSHARYYARLGWQVSVGTQSNRETDWWSSRCPTIPRPYPSITANMARGLKIPRWNSIIDSINLDGCKADYRIHVSAQLETCIDICIDWIHVH